MTDPVARYETRFNLFAALGAGVWLLFLAPAFQEAWDERGELAGWIGFLSLVIFCVVYIWSFLWGRSRRRHADFWRRLDLPSLGVVVVLLTLAVVAVLTLHASGLTAAVYISIAGITLLPLWLSIPTSVGLIVATETLARVVPGWEAAEGLGLSIGLATFAVWGIWTAMRRTRDLAAANEENAQLKFAEERARLARDLHDILGHSLTVIAVKAELADRLVEVSPERAHAEIEDIQRLSRDALADVRRTVDGVRELSLPAEIMRARAALEAAEIEAELPGSAEEVPSELRELFAWTMREAVTNVVRHSGASRCTVILAPDRIAIADNGSGMREAAGSSLGDGRGLTGLRERAAAAGAQVVVDAPPAGGFTLSVVARSDSSAVKSGGRARLPQTHRGEGAVTAGQSR
jgi:two-component system, NarL family, sensor histidine kinase DesK